MTKYGLIRNPADINYSVWFVPSAREASRRGSYWSGRSGGKKLGRQGRSGLRNGWTAKGNRRHQNKGEGSNGWALRSITGPHRAIVVSRHANGVAIALVLLDILRLAMMHRAITCIAAGWQIGGRKRPCQGGNARQKQRDQGHKRCEFARGLRHFYSASPDYESPKAYPDQAVLTRSDRKILTQFDHKDARSVPESTGQNGRYKSTIRCWCQVL